jgi:hypothetical protein
VIGSVQDRVRQAESVKPGRRIFDDKKPGGVEPSPFRRVVMVNSCGAAMSIVRPNASQKARRLMVLAATVFAIVIGQAQVLLGWGQSPAEFSADSDATLRSRATPSPSGA